MTVELVEDSYHTPLVSGIRLDDERLILMTGFVLMRSDSPGRV